MQAKLLRVLQEKVFNPVGSNRELEANVRIIAATNRNLEDMIKTGAFREDLFYRLNVIPIFLPPLRERIEDVEYMVNFFVNKFNQEHGKKVIGVAPEAMSCLKKYNWPGNIRELENVVEYAFVLEETNKVGITSLPEKILTSAGIQSSDRVQSASVAGSATGATDTIDTGDAENVARMVDSFDPTTLDFNRQKELFEKEFIIKALKTFKGRINQTALHANIPKKTLLRKIEKYGINPRDYLEVR
jgi:DNA-binding NtrC family response regulator